MTLDAVLSHIDDDLGNATDRLMGLMRIPSISTDPAYADRCRAAADWLVADLRGLGATAETRDTPAIRWCWARPARRGDRCCSTAITMFSPSTRWSSGRGTPSTPRSRTRRPARSFAGVGGRRQGPADDLRRGVPRLEGGHGPAAQRHIPVRGRRGIRLALAGAVPGTERTRADGRPGADLRHHAVRRGHAGHHHDAARVAGRGTDDHRPDEGPALGPVRRGRDQSDPGADAHPGRAARFGGAGDGARVLRPA